MVGAKHQYHDRATLAMARYIAKKAVIEDIRRKGDKVANYSARALIERADDYIAAHGVEIMHELVMRRCERWFEPMRYFER
jgi:hypothetical protein